MQKSSHYITHESLLIRLQNTHDTNAWDQFYETYRGLILSYAVKKGCSQSMGQDVLQETLITLTRKMPSFQYDRLKGQFRHYLLTIVKSRIIDAFRKEKKHIQFARGDKADEDNVEFPGEQSLSTDWEREWDKEWEQHLLKIALDKIKTKVKPHIFESFRLYALEKKSADSVSSILNIPKDNIYEHRRRIISMLKDEVNLLRSELGE